MRIRRIGAAYLALGVTAGTLAACEKVADPVPNPPTELAANTEGNGIEAADPALRARLTSIVATQLGIDPETVTPDSRFVEDLKADSLDAVELVMAAEEEFDISIPDEDAATLHTIRDVEAYLRKRGH